MPHSEDNSRFLRPTNTNTGSSSSRVYGGGGGASDYMALLSKIRQQNGSRISPNTRTAGDTGSIWNTKQQERQQERDQAAAAADQRREMNMAEKTFQAASDLSSKFNEAIGVPTSLKDIASNPIGKIAALTFSSMTSAVPSAFGALQDAYSAATGTDFSTADSETGTISTRQMNGLQKAGAVGSGLINALGVVTGGSAEGIDLARNAFGKEGAKRAAAKAASGLKGLAKEAGKSAFEEGAEEAVQSIFEDIRDDSWSSQSWSKALESGALGGIGGATAAAANFGGNALIAKVRGEDATKPQQQAANTDQATTTPEYWSLSHPTNKATGDPDAFAAEQIQKMQAKENQHKAGLSYTALDGGLNYTINQVGLGVSNVRRAYDTNPEYRAAIQEQMKFVRTPQQLDEIFLNSDDNVVIDQFNQALSDLKEGMVDAEGNMIPGGGTLKVLGLRNPNTKAAAQQMFDVKELLPGNAVKMNSANASAFGGDFDGDKVQYFSDGGIRAGGRYLTDMIMGSKTQETKDGLTSKFSEVGVDLDYFGLPRDFQRESYDEATRAKSHELFMKAVNNLEKVIHATFDSSVGEEFSNKWWAELREAYNGENAKGRMFKDYMLDDDGNTVEARGVDVDVLVPWVLQKMRNDLRNELSSGRDADEVMANFLLMAQEESQDYALMMSATMDSVPESDVKAEKPSVPLNMQVYDGQNFVTAGKLRWDVYVPAQVWTAYGRMVSALNNTDNSSLRTKQNFMWMVKTVDNVITEQGLRTLTPNQMENFLATTMQLVRQNGHPEDCVESVFYGFVLNDMKQNLGYQQVGGIGVDGKTVSTSDMLTAFAKAWNGRCDMYNDAVKVVYADYVGTKLGAPVKSKIEIDKINAGKPNSAEMQAVERQFMKVFGDMAVNDLFYEAVDGDFKNYTMSEYVEYLSDHVGFTPLPGLRDDTARKFVRALADHRLSEQHAREVRAMTVLEDIQLSRSEAPNFKDGTYDPSMVETYTVYLNALRSLVGGPASIIGGLVNVESALRSPYGPYLFSDDVNVRAAALRAIGMDYKWHHVIELLTRSRSEESPMKQEALRQQANDMAADLSTVSVLDEMVFHELNKPDATWEQREAFLRDLTDPSVSNGHIDLLFSDWQRAVKGTAPVTSGLFADALTYRESTLSGQLSIQIREANQAWQSYKKVSREQIKADWQAIKDLTLGGHGPIDQTMIQDKLNELCRRAELSMDANALASAIVEQAFINKPDVDKGKAANYGNVVYQQLAKRMEGMLASFMSRLTGVSVHSMTMTQFQSNKQEVLRVLADPTYSVDIFDPVTRTHTELNRDKFAEAFKLGPVDKKAGFNFNQWMMISEQIPQLSTWLSESVVRNSPSNDGSTTVGYNSTLSQLITKELEAKTQPDNRDDHDLSHIARVEDTQILTIIANRPDSVGAVLGRLGTSDNFDQLLGDLPALREKIADTYLDVAREYRSVASGGKIGIDAFISENRPKFRSRTAAKLYHDLEVSIRELTELQGLMDIEAGDVKAHAVNATADFVLASNIFGYMNDQGIKAPSSEWLEKKNEGRVKNAVDNELAKKKDYLEKYGTQIWTLLSVVQGSPADLTQRIMGPETLQALIDQYMDWAVNEDKDTRPRSEIEAEAKTNISKMYDDMNAGIMEGLAPVIGDAPVIFFDDLMLDGANSLKGEALEKRAHEAAVKVQKKIQRNVESGMYGVQNSDTILSVKKLEKMFIDDVKNSTHKFENIANNYNAIILRQTMDDLLGGVADDYNFAGYALELETFNSIADTLNDISDYMAKNGIAEFHSPKQVNKDKLFSVDFSKSKPLATLYQNIQTTLEGAGNTVNSGIEGGFYKDAEALSLLSRGVKDNIPGVQMTFGEFKDRVAQYNKAKSDSMSTAHIPFINPYDGAQIVGPDNVTFSYLSGRTKQYEAHNISDETVITVYPLTHSPHGVGEHTKLKFNGDNSDYVGLKQLLTLLGFSRSETSVFKRKKTIGVFTKVYNKLTSMGSKAMYQLDFKNQSREALLESFLQYRDVVAAHYYEGFKSEKMDGEFGRYDAYMLAQYTTPMIVFEGASDAGVQTATLTTDVLMNEELFAQWAAEHQELLSMDAVKASATVVPFEAITSSFARSVMNQWNAMEDPDSVGEDAMDTICMKALAEMGEYTDGGSEFIRNIYTGLKSIAPIGASLDAMPGQMSALGKFLMLKDPTSHLDSSAAGRAAAHLSLMDTQRAVFLQTIRKNLYPNDNKFLVAWTDIDAKPTPASSDVRQSKEANDNQGRQKWLSDMSAIGNSGTGTIPGESMAMIVSKDELTDNRFMDDFNQMLGAGGILLLDSKHEEVARRVLGERKFNRAFVGGDKVGKISCIALNPSNTMVGLRAPVYSTHVEQMSGDAEIGVFLAGYGGMAFGDSSLLVTHDAAEQIRAQVSSRFSVKAENLFPDVGFETPLYSTEGKLDDIVAACRQAFVGDSKKLDPDSHIVPSKDLNDRYVYDEKKGNYIQLKRELAEYLRKWEAGDVDEEGFVTGPVRMNEIVGFARTVVGGEDYYSPIFMDCGGAPLELDSVVRVSNPRFANAIEFSWVGNIGITEFDGVKVIFDTNAWKSFASALAEGDEAAMPHLFKPGVKRQNGNVLDVSGFYSELTEVKRRIDNGLPILTGNLEYTAKMIPHSIFYNYSEENGWTPKAIADASGAPISPTSSVWANLLNDSQFTTDDHRVATGEILLSADPELNRILQRLYQEFEAEDVSPTVMLSNIVNVNGDMQMRKPRDFQHEGILHRFNKNDILKLYHAICPTLCQNGMSDPNTNNKYLFNKDGMIRTTYNGKVDYRICHVQRIQFKEDATVLGNPSGEATFGNQQVIQRNMMWQRHASDFKKIREILNSEGNTTPGSEVGYKEYLRGGKFDKPIQKNPYMHLDASSVLNDSMLKASASSFADRAYRASCLDRGRGAWGERFDVYENDFDTEPVTKDKASYQKYQNVVDKFWEWCGFEDAETRPDDLRFHQLARLLTGSDVNDHIGSNRIDIDKISRALNRFKEAVKGGRYPIEGGLHNNRLSIPMGTIDIQDFIWDLPVVQQSKLGKLTRQQFDKLGRDEMLKSRDDLANIVNVRQRYALSQLYDFAAMQNNLDDWEMAVNEGYWSTPDFVSAMRKWQAYLSQAERDMIKAYDDAAEQSDRVVKALSERKSQQAMAKSGVRDGRGHLLTYWIGNDGAVGYGIARALKNMSTAMAVMHPMLAVSAPIQRAKASGLMKFELFLDESLGGPFQNRNNPLFADAQYQQILANRLHEDADVRRLWSALSILKFTTDEVRGLQNLHGEDLNAQIEAIAKRQGKMAEVSQKVFKFSSASGHAITMQMENFFNAFGSRINPTDNPWWFAETVLTMPDGQTVKTNRFVAEVLTNPTQALLDIMNTDQNPDFVAGQQAKNFAMMSDQAHDTAVTIFLNELFAQHPFVEALVKTGFLKFPNYVFNTSGWYLNHVLPMSSINYFITDKLTQIAARDAGLDPAQRSLVGRATAKLLNGTTLDQLGLDRAQVFSDFRQAAIHDMMTLGATWVGMGVLAAIDGLLEPPLGDDGEPDEEKMGNLSEWTILGMPIYQAWWLDDILGPALAIACTVKSAQYGAPRIDILANWMGDAMYKNPMLMATNIVTSLMEPGATPIDGYIEEAVAYEDYYGSATPSQVAAYDVMTYGMNWASQFITPSIVRDIYQNFMGDGMEHSYKRVYTDKAKGTTEKTDYRDVRIRQLTRNNPFWAFFFDVANMGDESKTGYAWFEMPLTRYYNEDQLASASAYSVVNEDGTPKSQSERRSIAYEIIGTLEACDDLEALKATGFYIDYNTRYVVSSYIWDLVHYTDEVYNQWVQDTGMDAYTVGDGDFTLGMQRISEIKQAYKDDRAHLNEIYDKLWDETLTSMETYNRYKTTYDQDINGEWYATGERQNPFSILPFSAGTGTAPGIFGASNPSYALDYTNGYETFSPLTGKSTGQRALIPEERDPAEKPAIETWAADGAGEQYSELADDSVALLEGSELTSGWNNWNNGTSGGGNRYGTRKSYGYRRSGGGGGSYSPNIYSRLPSVNSISSARVGGSSRPYSANYDYLRPSFETKGSREAYKREDI